jgi:1-acyl-sn-glycerol-3-phosphate acyltransferase
MARETLFSNRLFGMLISSLNTIPLKRDQAHVSAFRSVLKVLQQGRPVCLFPEGTRTVDGKVSSFKPGFGFLCRKTGAVLIPVVIDGAFECWPRSKKIFSPGRITVRFGPAVPADVTREATDRELADVVTATVRKMQNECRRESCLRPYEY